LVCEYCNYSVYDMNDMFEHLKEKHKIDVLSSDSNWGLAGDNLIVSDLVVPVELQR